MSQKRAFVMLGARNHSRERRDMRGTLSKLNRSKWGVRLVRALGLGAAAATPLVVGAPHVVARIAQNHNEAVARDA
jgi:hypothetical protein